MAFVNLRPDLFNDLGKLVRYCFNWLYPTEPRRQDQKDDILVLHWRNDQQLEFSRKGEDVLIKGDDQQCSFPQHQTSEATVYCNALLNDSEVTKGVQA